MLELRPICENCKAALPPDSTEAMICSFECTFCRRCVETVLQNVCPNCGGGFCYRPIRPQHDWKNGDYLGKFPANTQFRHRPINPLSHGDFARLISPIPPERR